MPSMLSSLSDKKAGMMAITLTHTEVAYMTPKQFKACRLKMRISQKKLGELI